jgi:hypothetical protein
MTSSSLPTDSSDKRSRVVWVKFRLRVPHVTPISLGPLPI